MRTELQNKLLIYLVVWLVVGAFLSPHMITAHFYDKATAEQVVNYRIQQIVKAERVDGTDLFVCFDALYDDGGGVFELYFDISTTLLDSPREGVVEDKYAAKLGVPEYKLSDEWVVEGCASHEEGVPLDISSLKRGSILGYKHLLPNVGESGGVYWLDGEWSNNHQIIVVGKFVGGDGYLVLELPSKPAKKKTHYLWFLPFAFIVDSFAFPLEWYLLSQFRG